MKICICCDKEQPDSHFMKGNFHFRCRECHASIINAGKASRRKSQQAQIEARINGEMIPQAVTAKPKEGQEARRDIENILAERQRIRDEESYC